MSDLATIAQLLAATGPYGIIAILWRAHAEKERALLELTEKFARVVADATVANRSIAAAMRELRDAVEARP